MGWGGGDEARVSKIVKFILQRIPIKKKKYFFSGGGRGVGRGMGG